MTTLVDVEPPLHPHSRWASPLVDQADAPRWSLDLPAVRGTAERELIDRPKFEPEPAAQLVLELFVRDLERSRRFYAALGFRPVRCGSRFAEVIWDGCSLCLYQPPMIRWAHTGEVDDTPRTNLQVLAEDVEAVWRRVNQLGARILEPLADQPNGRRDFMVADPDGFGIRFVSRARV